MMHRALWAVLAVAALVAVPAASANEARVLDSEDDEIVIELATDDYSLEEVSVGGESFVRVRAPRYHLAREEGRPLLPRHVVLVGVPFGARLSLDIVSVESEDLGRQRVEPAPHEEIVLEGEISTPIERFAIDEDFYARGGAHPAVIAELGGQGTLRHQRIARVVLNPFQYSPGTGNLTLHDRIVVRVSIAESRRPSDMVDAIRVEPEWERVYERSVLNHQQAARWRMRPEPRRGVSGPRYGSRAEAYRILTTESGMHRVDFSDLAAEGLDSTTPVDDVAVFQRSFDEEAPDPFVETPLAIDVVDEDDDGVFDGDDYLLFHAQSFEEQYMVVGDEDIYGSENAYWFAEDSELAERMGTRSGWLDEPGLMEPASFRDTVRFEEDVYLDVAPDYDHLDLYHWTRYQYNADNYQLPFTLYDVHSAGNAVMRARYQGMTSGWHYIDFRVSYGDTADNYVGEFSFYGLSATMAEDIYESGSLPPWYFTDGSHELRATGSRGSGANLDWFEFEYDREFTARDRRLSFTNAGELGVSQFEVDAFSTDGIRLFDVSDPWGSGELVLGPENVSGGTGDYTLTFQDDVGGFTRYEAVEPGGYHSVTGIERREPAGLWSDEADVIVVSHDSFAAGVEPLIAHRESQGWTVAHARVSEVYDEFGTGFKSLQALRNYFSYAFESWDRTPQFAMFVGDACEDPKRTEASSQRDYIPTVLGHGSPNYPHMTASDQWFIVSMEPDHYLPQMFLGRLSVSNNTELDNLVSKILAYENYSSGEEWRNRATFLADDEWRYGTYGGSYLWDWGEGEFTTVSVALSEMIDASPAGMDTSLFMLRRHTDILHDANGVGHATQPWSYFFSEVYPYTRTTLTPELLSMLNEGSVLFNFQGHGNREQMTHEQVIEARTEGYNDISELANDGKPFIFLGFSCHLAQFASRHEGAALGYESITEQMLFLPERRGAVAGFACSGAAYRSHNADYNTEILEAFFDPQTPAGDPDDFFWPRWTLGSILAQGTVNYVSTLNGSVPTRSYVLLGDPLLRLEASPPTMQVTVDGEPLLSGEYLESSGGELVTFVADIIDEVEMDPASFVVRDHGDVIDDQLYTVEAVGDTLGEIGRWYRLTYGTTIGEEMYDISISATDVNGQTTTFVVHIAGSTAIKLDQVINHPNPFFDTTKIIYMLNQSNAEVSIDIYTVGGRLIKTIEDASGELNYNEVEWDGVDDDGDMVANGLYLYVVEARGEDGSVATSDVGRMAVVRGSRSDRQPGR